MSASLTFNDIFSYEHIEYYKDYPDRDSDTYVNCVMLKSVGHLTEGQSVPFICVSMEIMADDQAEYLYDRELVPPFPFIYRTSKEVSDCIGSNRTDRAAQCKHAVYYDCEFLQDIGSFQSGEEYPYIRVVTSLFAFDKAGQLMI
jgi:hypothetical protein